LQIGLKIEDNDIKCAMDVFILLDPIEWMEANVKREWHKFVFVKCHCFNVGSFHPIWSLCATLWRNYRLRFAAPFFPSPPSLPSIPLLSWYFWRWANVGYYRT
jgi:hypothetical protein